MLCQSCGKEAPLTVQTVSTAHIAGRLPVKTDAKGGYYRGWKTGHRGSAKLLVCKKCEKERALRKGNEEERRDER